MKKSIRILLTALLMLSFSFSLFRFWQQQQDKATSANTYSDALALASSGTIEATEPQEPTVPPTTEAVEETKPDPVPVWVVAPLEEEDPHIQTLMDMDLDALREVNPDVVGWILIPDTKINYPLMQGEDNDYYLNHTWDQKKNGAGSIYLEQLSNPELTDFNTIIYGHNMANGSMFANLHQYRYQNFWESHPYVYIRTDEGVYRYEIFSAYRANVDSNTYALSFSDEEFKEEFLQYILSESVIETGVQPEITDRILTLSTCSGAGYSTRWVVQARLKMELRYEM